MEEAQETERRKVEETKLKAEQVGGMLKYRNTRLSQEARRVKMEAEKQRRADEKRRRQAAAGSFAYISGEASNSHLNSGAVVRKEKLQPLVAEISRSQKGRRNYPKKRRRGAV